MENQPRGRIADSRLRAQDVPGPRASWRTVSEFALTTDGNARSRRCAEIANDAIGRFRLTGEVPRDLRTLRLALFFEQRRWRHFGETPDKAALKYLRALVAGIRAEVNSKAK